MRKRVLAVALGACLMAFTGAAESQTSMSLPDFQGVFRTYAELMESQSLLERLETLTQEEWLALYEAFPDEQREAFAQAVTNMAVAASGLDQNRLGE